MVGLVNGKVSLDPQDVAQIGRCNFVKDLSIRVDFDLVYFVARDLKDNLNNAANAEGPGDLLPLAPAEG